jgi:hypothetical protein
MQVVTLCGEDGNANETRLLTARASYSIESAVTLEQWERAVTLDFYAMVPDLQTH